MKLTKQDSKIILQEGEGYTVEFKESLSGLDKEITAFANASGGKILLGVDDDGKVKGIKITNTLKSQIQDIANNCRPRIKIFFEEIGNVLTVYVWEGDDKPYECSSGFYKRLGPNSQKITRNEIVSLLKSEGKVRFDELIEPKFFYPKDFDKAKLNKFLELAEISKTVKSKDALVTLEVAQKQQDKLYLNNAGVLLFAKEPQRFISWSVFTVVLFKDKDGVDIIDRKEITGNLFEIVAKAMDFVKLYAKVAYRITGKPRRDNIYEYAFEAVREAVINSVMHKDYFERGHNNILKFFPNRIQIENIWIKPRNFVLGKTVFRRNHRLADLFNRIHFGEKIGSGMKRMKNICKQENTPYPRINYTDTHFYIVFKQSREYLKMAQIASKGEGLNEGLNEGLKSLIECIKTNPGIQAKTISLHLNRSIKTIERQIKELKNLKKVERKGSKKTGGYWTI